MKAKAVGLSGEAKTLAAMFADQEQQHVGALTQAIKQGGGTPVKKPTFAFPATNQASFLKLAYMLENTGVGAYNGAGPALKSKALLAAAGSIVQVEARHAAVDRRCSTGEAMTPTGAFERRMTKAAVLKAAGPLIK